MSPGNSLYPNLRRPGECVPKRRRRQRELRRSGWGEEGKGVGQVVVLILLLLKKIKIKNSPQSEIEDPTSRYFTRTE